MINLYFIDIFKQSLFGMKIGSDLAFQLSMTVLLATVIGLQNSRNHIGSGCCSTSRWKFSSQFSKCQI